MLADLNMLAQKLEADSTIKVVVSQSAHPESLVAHSVLPGLMTTVPSST